MARSGWQCVMGLVVTCATPVVVAQMPPQQINATVLLDEALEPGVSLIWSPTGQLAWDELRRYHQVEDIDFELPTPTSEALNEFKWDAATSLPKTSFGYGGDYTEASAEMIRRKITSIMGPTPAKLITPPPPNGPVAGESGVIRLKSALIVSALVSNAKFVAGFTPHPDPRPFQLSSGKKVLARGFGVHGVPASYMDSAMQVVHDDMAGNFVLAILVSDPAEPRKQKLYITSQAGLKSLIQGVTLTREKRAKPMPDISAVESRGRTW